MSETTWQDILKKALSEPGTISEAYSMFWNYSSGNQMLAYLQCAGRGIQPGPMASYNGWREKGRHVKQGAKAIALWMPITGKRTVKQTNEDGAEEETAIGYTRFIVRANWFVLEQTEGQELQAEPVPAWDESKALETLQVSKVPFEHLDGNCQGYAQKGRKVAINPLAENPHKTMFHELAHVILHTDESGAMADGENTPRTLKEVEAESVALICCESLGLPGAEFSRGYIQSWGAGLDSIPEKSCQKIFKAADQILKAGRTEKETPRQELARLKAQLAAMQS